MLALIGTIPSLTSGNPDRNPDVTCSLSSSVDLNLLWSIELVSTFSEFSVDLLNSFFVQGGIVKNNVLTLHFQDQMIQMQLVCKHDPISKGQYKGHCQQQPWIITRKMMKWTRIAILKNDGMLLFLCNNLHIFDDFKTMNRARNGVMFSLIVPST